MKFYYEGTLLRTSKTHHYTHAIIKRTNDGIKCIGCSSSLEKAKKLMENHPTYQDYKLALSVQNGTYKKRNSYSNSIEYLKERAIENYGSIDAWVNRYETIINSWEIVEIKEM